MNVGKAIDAIMVAFRVTSVESLSRISAAEAETVRGVGGKTLLKIRKHLAERGIAFRGDNGPEYWINYSMVDPFDLTSSCPFTIVCDVNETYPFTFSDIRGSDGNPIHVPTVIESMWRMGLADYSVKGMESLVQIERKAADLFSSLSERRENFEAEIARLDSLCEFAAVVSEIPMSEIELDIHTNGARTRSVISTIDTWRVRYPGVHWIFCDGRASAESTTYRLLDRFWRIRQLREADVNMSIGGLKTQN